MNMEMLERGSAAVKSAFGGAKPACGIVLGSGLGEAAQMFEVKDRISYSDIPSIGAAGVGGHDGELQRATYAGREVFLFRGRRHFYEGVGWEPIVSPVHILKSFGAASVLLTNSAGGIRSDLGPGSLMVVSDHINLIGSNPLVGAEEPFFGPRFPDQSSIYDTALTDEAVSRDMDLSSGVYAAVCGPTYETPAEVRALAMLGADAVGMSTVPEAMVASASGMKVAAISCVVNKAAGLGTGPELKHEDVIAAAGVMAEKLGKLISVYVETTELGAI